MTKKPLFAIPSFPGSNGEVDNVRTLKRCGFDCFVFRWNDSLEKLRDVDGYFFGAGFSYEDRGRSGMVAARDPLFDFIRTEAAAGKVVIGNCNGAQVLVESGLIPLGDDLRMCLAHNAIKEKNQWKSPGFLNQWVWVTRSCKRDRCATSDWEGAMHIPIAHGEGRFVTHDPDVIKELRNNDQIAFQYSDALGKTSPDAPITPNGSSFGIAGICNKEGNVVALMPHPERTERGDAYFLSIHSWMKRHARTPSVVASAQPTDVVLQERPQMPVEVFIDTIITNNEERTVEQAARRLVPTLQLRQFRYTSLVKDDTKSLLSSLSFFNPHKEVAYVRVAGEFFQWNADRKKSEKLTKPLLTGISLLRRNNPDTSAAALGEGVQTGICYDCRDVPKDQLLRSNVCHVFGNPHASSIELLTHELSE